MGTPPLPPTYRFRAEMRVRAMTAVEDRCAPCFTCLAHECVRGSPPQTHKEISRRHWFFYIHSCSFLCAGAFSLGLGPICWLFCSEILPVEDSYMQPNPKYQKYTELTCTLASVHRSINTNYRPRVAQLKPLRGPAAAPLEHFQLF